MIYFETSAWNRLAETPDRKALLGALSHRGEQVLASVITVGEVLRTGNPAKRRLLCEIMETAHGPQAPLLDHPEHLARYAAESWRHGENTIEIRQGKAASVLWRYLTRPSSISDEERREVEGWVRAMDEDQNEVFADLAVAGPRLGPKFCSAEILARPELNALMAEKLPVPRELGLTGEQVAELCDKSDIWKAYRAGLAYVIDAALDKMPETRSGGKRRQKRPGGPDIRQAIYLGICDTFVLRDEWLQESLTEIAAACGFERRILATDEFFEEIRALDAGLSSAG